MDTYSTGNAKFYRANRPPTGNWKLDYSRATRPPRYSAPLGIVEEIENPHSGVRRATNSVDGWEHRERTLRLPYVLAKSDAKVQWKNEFEDDLVFTYEANYTGLLLAMATIDDGENIGLQPKVSPVI